MKRLLVLIVVLHAAPAHAICERLDVVDREIDLDDAWVAAPAPDGKADELWNNDLTDMHAIVRVEGPSPDACASWPAAMGLGWKEVTTRPPRFDDRYDRFWQQPRVNASSACLDTDRGAYLVQVSGMMVVDQTDRRLDAIAGRVADALTSDVACWWEDSSAPGGCTELPNQQRQIELPGGWRIESTTIDGKPVDELFNDRLTGPFLGSPAGAVTLHGPFSGSCADQLRDSTEQTELAKPSLFGARYAKVWQAGDGFPTYTGCIDTDRGFVFVNVSLVVVAPEHWDDAELLGITDRIADAVTGVACAAPVAPEEPAPIYGECVLLPRAGRTIALPSDWALLRDDATSDHLISPRYAIGLSIDFFPGKVCEEVGFEYYEGVLSPGFTARYEFFDDNDEAIDAGCIQTAAGAWAVNKHGSEAELEDPGWLGVTEAVADMILSEVTCGVGGVIAPWTPAKPPPTWRADASAAFVHSELPLGSYSLDELALSIGGSYGPLWVGTGLRLGSGYGSLFEGGFRVGAVFGERTRIAATAGFEARKLGDDRALGFGLRVGVTQQLPKRLFALGAVEARWMSTTLEYTVPAPRSEQGPLEFEPSVLLGGGWRFLYGGFESRALEHYNQRTYGVVLGVRYQN